MASNLDHSISKMSCQESQDLLCIPCKMLLVFFDIQFFELDYLSWLPPPNLKPKLTFKGRKFSEVSTNAFRFHSSFLRHKACKLLNFWSRPNIWLTLDLRFNDKCSNIHIKRAHHKPGISGSGRFSVYSDFIFPEVYIFQWRHVYTIAI